jgi:hypothetical protein
VTILPYMTDRELQSVTMTNRAASCSESQEKSNNSLRGLKGWSSVWCAQKSVPIDREENATSGRDRPARKHFGVFGEESAPVLTGGAKVAHYNVRGSKAVSISAAW